MVTASPSSFSVCPVALSALFILVDSPSQMARFRPLLLFSLCPAALRLTKTESVERKTNQDQDRIGSARFGFSESVFGNGEGVPRVGKARGSVCKLY